MSTLKSKFISAPVNGPTVEPLILQTNNIDRVTVDASGNLLATNNVHANNFRCQDTNWIGWGDYSVRLAGDSAFDTLSLVTNNTERARIDSNGQMRTTDGTGAVSLAYDCRAWVNFNGTGTVAIRASGNVSSITDGGVGIYTVNFTNAMPDALYTVVCSNGADASGSSALVTANPSQSATYSTTQVRVVSGFMGSGAGNRTSQDTAFYNVAVFR